MKNSKRFLKRAASALLILLILVSLVPDGVRATVDYEEEDLDCGNGATLTALVYECPECGHGYRVVGLFGSDPEPEKFDDFFCDECGLCNSCAREKTHCASCGDCTDSGDYCTECHKCRDCWSADEHCPVCHEHDTERCSECSYNACYDCHDQHNAGCPLCGTCLFAKFDEGEICNFGGGHCTDCCILCEDCDECFTIDSNTVDEGEFCTNCGLCIECGIEDEQHCPKCRICYQDNDRCESEEVNLCLECCVDAGNHCPDCGKHVGEDGDWCPTEPAVHCLECAEPYLCPDCGECMFCMDVERCEDCGRCPDCCLANSESYGCECGLCVESAEFEDPEHCCAGCGIAFSCVEEFCEDCGLCMDCCLAASEDAGCVCGICVENSEFEDDTHMCSNCGGFTCVNGEICDYCGYCEECCLEASEDAGCVCGICVEDSDFSAPDHLCESCEAAFSCVTAFCGDCGYCEDCCKAETESMGCIHEICVKTSAWSEHFCEECDCCKELCDCGQPCCAITEYSYERSTVSILGSILSQPRNVGTYVSDGSNDDYLHTNRISFYVGVFGDPSELYYQWYRKDGPEGTPEKLADEAAGDEEYWGRNDVITGGATAQTLSTYVPADACVKEYYYYCEITDRDGNLLSRTRDAKLRARHRYEWVPAEGGHIYRCVGCGALGKFADEIREHELSERQILVYPTETETGLLGNRCQVCGYAEGEVIAPLGKHEQHVFRYYYTTREHWCECVCGKKINARSEHSWGDWILDKPATEKTRGSKHHVCLVCGCREDVKIEKTLHAHGPFYTGDPYYGSFHMINQKQHAKTCDYPGCAQYYAIEAHTFTEWEITVWPGWSTEGSMERSCTGCGYTQTKKIPKTGTENGSKRILTVDHGKSTKTASLFLSYFNDTPVLTAEDRPGYLFNRWYCELCYYNKGEDPEYDGVHVLGFSLLNPGDYNYQTGTTYKIKVDDPTSEVMTVLELPNALRRLPKLENVDWDKCWFHFFPDYEYLPLTVEIWPEDSCRLGDQLILYPNKGYNGKTGAIVDNASLDMHYSLYLEVIETEDNGVGYPYEYILHMNGYKGGPIRIISPQASAQLNCKVTVSIDDRESVIRSIGGKDYGLAVHCLNGGEVYLASENGGKLTIDVEGGRTFDVYGIDVQDEIGRTTLMLLGADLEIVSTNLSKPSYQYVYGGGSIEQSAQGIHAGDVRILGGRISIEAHAPHLDNALAAVGINAEVSIDIDSPELRIDVTDVDVGAGGTGVGLNAKSVEISMLLAEIASIGQEEEDEEAAALMGASGTAAAYAKGIFINYPENGVGVKLPREKSYSLAAITTYGETEEGDKTFVHRLGYTVMIDYDPDKLTLSPVGRVYVDEMGRFCVPAGEALEFVAAAAPGYRGNNIGLYRDGKTYILPDIDPDENRRYRIEQVTENLVLELGGVQPVAPFASDPLPSTQTVLGGGLGTAAVTWEMNAYEVQKLNRKNAGKQSANGVLDRHGEGEVFQTDTAYSAGVWLQSYNDATGRWINRPELGTFTAKQHAFAEFTEERQYSRPGTTTTYRLALLFDGLHYFSEPFEVTWTADEEEVSSRIASAMELYMTNAWNSNGGDTTIYDGGDSGTWMRLDARCSDIYYDIQSGLYVNSFDRTKKKPTVDEGYIRFAHFDASKGVLTIDAGQSGYWNSDKDVEYWYDTTDAVLCEIRTAEDSRGDLTVYAAGDCGIYQDTSSVGWIDQWGNGKLVHFADNAAILKNTGSVILTGAKGAELTVRASGPYDMVRTQREDGSWYYTGERISAVRASGSIRVDGPLTLKIIADCEKDTVPKPGYAGCAVGLDAQGDILVCGETTLSIDVGTFSVNPAGAAQGMYAGGNIRMEDSCSVDIWTNTVQSSNLACNKRGSVWAEKTVTVDGQASLSVYSFGEELCAVYAGECAFICSDRAARISAVPSAEDVDSCAVIAPRTVVNGFHTFTWRDQDRLSPVSGELDLGEMNTYVSYLSEPSDWDGSRTLTVMEGMPRRLELITQGLSVGETQVEITRNGDTASVTGSEFPVCPGDTVTLFPPEGLPGSSFQRWGWPQYEPRDIMDMGAGVIRFTMPDWDVTPIAVFDTSVVSDFTFTLDGSDPAMTGDHRIGKADIGFRVEIPADFAPGTQLKAIAKLECTYLNGEDELVWADEETMPANRYVYLYSDEAAYDQGMGIASFDVSKTIYLADVVPEGMISEDWLRVYESPDRSYRLRIILYTVDDGGRSHEWCSLVTNPFELSWNKPFTADVDGEGRNPEIVIPSGDVGTSFAIDFSRYVSGGSGEYHYSIIPAVEPVPMEFLFNEDLGTFCFFHTESSVGMNYTDNIMQIHDKRTGEIALIYFDVLPTVATQMYDTYVGGVHVSEYNREDVLGDGKVSYTPAAEGECAKLTLNGVKLTSGFCGRQDPAVSGDNAFAAIFTREDLEIVLKGASTIALDEYSEAPGNAYIPGSLIAGIYGFGANVTLSGSGGLIVTADRGVCLAEDSGHKGGSLTLNGSSLTVYAPKGNVFGKAGSEGFTYAGGRFTGISAQESDTPLLNGVSFAEGKEENTVLLLSHEADWDTAQQGSPETLAAQQPGAPFRYIRIQPADRMEEEPASGVIVNEESGEICVYVDKSAKGVTTMTAIVAVYDKATGQFLDLWMGEIAPTDPLTGTGLIYDESKHYRIMVVDGDTWRPLGEHGDI